MTLREKILGKNFFEVFPDNPNDSSKRMSAVRISLEKVLQDHQPDTMEVRGYDIPRPAAEGGGFDTKYWSSVNIPILAPDGEVDYIIRRVEDITTLVMREGEHKVIEQERNLFFNYSFDLLAVVGTDGYFKHLNPAFERAMGYSEKELCAQPIIQFLHPDDVAKTKERMRSLAAGTPTISSVNRYRCKDGTYKSFSWNTTPIGPLLYTIGRDITAQVEAEERIRQMHVELAQKNEDLELKIQERLVDLRRSEAQVQQLQKMDAIGRLAGGIAHDFNNMLSAISLYCEMMLEEPKAYLKHVQEIENVLKSATALTRQLLIFSRKQIVQVQTVHLNPLIHQLESMLVRIIGEHIKFTTRLAEDLSPVNVDPSQLEQVVLNLVVNAKDAMPRGGNILLETRNVYLDESFTSTHLSVNPGPYVLLSVSDDGIGMDTETVAKIFEPFFTTKPVGQGTGLGLTTTYGIIKQSKGTIWVYSEPGNGTVFKIYLPVAEGEREEKPMAPLPARSEVIGTETILLVEDDEKLREGFASMLRKKGYRVLIAANGNEALEICESFGEPLHLLLTDMVMPGLNGFELAKKIQSLRGGLPVLYMSGYTNDVLENSGIENLGQLEFIQKPFSTRTLVEKVQEILLQTLHPENRS